MKAFMAGKSRMVEVDAEEFSIEGTTEKFIVHRNILAPSGPAYAATHMETGFRIATGDCQNEAIKNGAEAWQSKTPEYLAEFLARARAWKLEVEEGAA